jgi:two-component SAPR family response regulator
VDGDEFETALAKAHAASSEEAAARWYEQAISLYHDEYLDDLYYNWLFPERRRLTQLYISACGHWPISTSAMNAIPMH